MQFGFQKYKSSRSKIYLRIGVLKNFAIFTGRHLCWCLFFNEYAGLNACNFIKNRLQHKFFPVKFVKFLRTLFFTEHVRWLFLEISYELSLSLSLLHLRTMNGVISWALQRLFHFTVCVTFLSVSLFFFYFLSWILLLFDFEVSLSILKVKQWSYF